MSDLAELNREGKWAQLIVIEMNPTACTFILQSKHQKAELVYPRKGQ